MAVDHACYQGEPVAAVVANGRAEAEDAADLVMVEYEELPAVTQVMEALVNPRRPSIRNWAIIIVSNTRDCYRDAAAALAKRPLRWNTSLNSVAR